MVVPSVEAPIRKASAKQARAHTVEAHGQNTTQCRRALSHRGRVIAQQVNDLCSDHVRVSSTAAAVTC